MITCQGMISLCIVVKKHDSSNKWKICSTVNARILVPLIKYNLGICFFIDNKSLFPLWNDDMYCIFDIASNLS